MTDFYVIRSSGSDSNGGTSEGDAFENIVTGVSAAYEAGTGGHVVWVKGNGNTYEGTPSIGTSYNLGKYGGQIVGYGDVTGDECMGGTYPEMRYQFHISATGWSARNFNIYYDPIASQSEFSTNPNWGGVFSCPNHCSNFNIHCTNSHSGGQYGGVFSAGQSVMHSNFRITFSPGFKLINPGFGLFGADSTPSRGGYDGIYADASGCLFPNHNPAYFFNFNNNDHGGVHQFAYNTLIAPDPSAYPMVGMNYRFSAYCHGVKIRNCIFVNCSTGIYLYTNIADQAALISASRNEVMLIEDCIFINCEKGIDADPSFQFPTTIRNCAFYNSTTSNISSNLINVDGTKICTQDPWDSTNGMLNEYGMTLLGNQTHKGTGTADFATPDPDRPFYQIVGKAASSFSTTDSGSLSLGGSGVGDKITVSGRTYQLISADPIVWRRSDA